MFKKLLAAAAMTALLAGSALADTKLKLVEVITSPERTETLKSIVKGFEDANPGTSVEIIQYENIDDNPAVEDIRITCLNRPLNRCSPPPTWQQRRMNVQAAILRKKENSIRQKLAEGNDNDTFGRKVLKLFHYRFIIDVGRLQNIEFQL